MKEHKIIGKFMFKEINQLLKGMDERNEKRIKDMNTHSV